MVTDLATQRKPQTKMLGEQINSTGLSHSERGGGVGRRDAEHKESFGSLQSKDLTPLNPHTSYPHAEACLVLLTHSPSKRQEVLFPTEAEMKRLKM